jgi:putative intracellular protease/amidase
MSNVLMIISAADSLTLADGTSHPTGYWAEEVAASHRVFREAGVQVRIATPGGRVPTVDPVSLDARGGVEEGDAKEFRAYLDTISAELQRPLPLADVQVGDYDAVYLPGGHGPMADLVDDADLARVLAEADARAVVVAALCHGPAGLLSAVDASGNFLFAGRRLTTFTDEEEMQGGLGKNAPYLVESRLRELGAVVETAPAWSSNVVADGNLITGQNPQSSVATAERVLQALSR